MACEISWSKFISKPLKTNHYNAERDTHFLISHIRIERNDQQSGLSDLRQTTENA